MTGSFNKNKKVGENEDKWTAQVSMATTLNPPTSRIKRVSPEQLAHLAKCFSAPDAGLVVLPTFTRTAAEVLVWFASKNPSKSYKLMTVQDRHKAFATIYSNYKIVNSNPSDLPTFLADCDKVIEDSNPHMSFTRVESLDNLKARVEVMRGWINDDLHRACELHCGIIQNFDVFEEHFQYRSSHGRMRCAFLVGLRSLESAMNL